MTVHYSEFNKFNKTKLIKTVVIYEGRYIDSEKYDNTLWIERPEDWYALKSEYLKSKRIRIVTRNNWLTAKEI